MRIASMAAAIGLAASASVSASVARAAPEVVVNLGPELSDQADKTYGRREVDRLATSLHDDVERALFRTGAYDDSRIELNLVAVKPNRPTAKQMGDRPGLSLLSFGLGGATIEGRIVGRDGDVTPISYSWYETSLRDAAYQSTWGDADYAFSRFARRLADGKELARR